LLPDKWLEVTASKGAAPLQPYRYAAKKYMSIERRTSEYD